jgi:hypothetical protein
MDELTVIQDFVSDDYFSSDAAKESFKAKALELRKEWEQEAATAEAEGRDPGHAAELVGQRPAAAAEAPRLPDRRSR